MKKLRCSKCGCETFVSVEEPLHLMAVSTCEHHQELHFTNEESQ